MMDNTEEVHGTFLVRIFQSEVINVSYKLFCLIFSMANMFICETLECKIIFSILNIYKIILNNLYK